jgi:hypothetical protein
LNLKILFVAVYLDESKHNTFKRPNLLGIYFNDSCNYKCTFIAQNNGKKQYIFAKPGIVNSGFILIIIN